MWPDNRVLDLFGIQSPIIPAPMAGSVLSEMVVAVSEAGGLGSLPSALLTVEQARSELEIIRRQTSRPINVNFVLGHAPSSSATSSRSILSVSKQTEQTISRKIVFMHSTRVPTPPQESHGK